ncbi:hypothetical protein AGJ32_16570 [Cronobacter turicensis]|nr:hypothetical protein [Cronobacter turicensis]EGT5741722.1 hypothetical protein [Cronobacter turicensis]
MMTGTAGALRLPALHVRLTGFIRCRVGKRRAPALHVRLTDLIRCRVGKRRAPAGKRIAQPGKNAER